MVTFHEHLLQYYMFYILIDCRIGEFRCNSGTLYECFDGDRVCDGITDCWDNSDEIYCDYAGKRL